VVVARPDSQTGLSDLWKLDPTRGSESRLTSRGHNTSPVWSAHDTDIFFLANRDGVRKVYKKPPILTGPEEVVEAAAKLPRDASLDGQYLMTQTSADSRTGADIWVLPLLGSKPFPYLQTAFQEMRPRLSPDGHWLAYQSNESKRPEIYVDSFPHPSTKWPISTTGGQSPVWSRDGHKLFYCSLGNKIMAVSMTPGAQNPFGVPEELFEVRLLRTNTSFEVSQDGQQFLLPAPVEQEGSTPMTVVLNWPEILKSK
jgi:Tol biopolymer transport system component